jgi:hypothetical protein
MPMGAGDSTSTENRQPSSPLVRGFGAPLWVLLLAVVGVGLRTMSIIINDSTVVICQTGTPMLPLSQAEYTDKDEGVCDGTPDS